ncbi:MULTISPECIES: alpha/beta fold hydrolase [Salinibaculum]|uniref:alpha/beta fold hydrolase n=1 Tax=Salinibaculum TaxID=2732368 RepID=UPI0030CE7E96
MFEDFDTRVVETSDAEIHLRLGGDGPPLVLVHGYPQTHVAWHAVAPALAEQFSVVVPDLRGYGDSIGPDEPTTADYSNRAMGRDIVELMGRLGYDRFGLAGHDRGGRVAYRLALDHPDRVDRLAVLDMVPNVEKLDRFTPEMAEAAFHWFLLAQPSPLPERLIGNDPAFFIDTMFERWAGDGVLSPDAIAEYRRCFCEDDTIRAICADYRAGLSLDVEHDRQDREQGRQIACPVLSLWGTDGKSDLRPVWERWADDVTGAGIDSGHFIMEEAPEETRRHLADFFG